MNNPTIQLIKNFAIRELQGVYGSASLLENDNVIIINADDIKITINKD